MVTRNNAWWMTRSKGIYIFSVSPFRQRAFAGFGREIKNLAKLHWTGVAYFASIAAGGYYLLVWANQYYHHSMRKDPLFYDREAAELATANNTEQ
jgi:hypothetical protein